MATEFGPLSNRAVLDLVRDLPDAVLVVDSDGTIRTANAAVQAMLGWSPKALEGRSVHSLVPPEMRDTHVAHHAGFRLSPRARPMGTGLDLEALRSDGELVPVEIALIPLNEPSGWVAAIVHDVTRRRRLLHWVSAKSDLVSLMVDGADRPTLVDRFTELVAASTHADGVWVELIDDTREHAEVVGCVDPLDAGALGRRTRLAESALSQSDERISTIVVPADEDHGAPATRSRYGPALLIRMFDEAGVLRGSVTLARGEGRVDFDPPDRDFARGIVEILETALNLDEARETRARHQRMLDRERIARDLHDSIIQRLFAEGLRLEATAEVATGVVADRLRAAASHLDEVIRDIRTTIFDLQTPASAAGGLREGVLSLVEDVEAMSDLRIRVGFDGPVETEVPEPLADDLLIVLREGLMNVVKHSAASTARVDLALSNGDVVLTITDDGEGFDHTPGSGFGLPNLRERADARGGTMRIGHPPGSTGTEVRWAVPIA